MNLRVFRKSDDSIFIYSAPDGLQRDGETDADVLDRLTAPFTELSGLEYFDADPETIPSLGPGEIFEQYYISGLTALENLAIDSNWENQLPSLEVARAQHLDRLQTKIDDELAAMTPDAIVILGFLNEKIQVPDWAPLEVYTAALADLDEDVANMLPDKPTLRTKLNAKILELSE